MEFEPFYQQYRQTINAYLQQITNSIDKPTAQLAHALDYSTQNGGKRFRPLLVYAVASTLTPGNFSDFANNATRCATACELIHCYSLVHDDLPAMDDDDWRRGKLACHKQFDEATAILVGDALQALAFEIISQPMQHIDPKYQLAMITLLANAIGANGMVAGQALDIANSASTLDALITVHRLKTGALFKAAVSLGARCVGCDDEVVLATLDTFADQFGLAYQIQDDILDVTQSDKTLGKPQHSDQNNNKYTFVSLLGLEQATAYLQTTYQHAASCLAKLDFSDTVLQHLLEKSINREY